MKPFFVFYIKSAITKSNERKTSLPAVFPFEEDTELHSKVVMLGVKYRIPLVLSSFQDLSNEQIAMIIGISIPELLTRIETAKSFLGEEQLEKRLNLLRKSYNRLPVQFEVEQFIVTTSKTVKKVKKKKKLWMMVGAFIFTVGILSLLFIPNKSELAASDPFMIELQEKYKAERNKRQEMLQLTDERFDKLEFHSSSRLENG